MIMENTLRPTNARQIGYREIMTAVPGNIRRDCERADLSEDLFHYVDKNLDQEIKNEPSGWIERWVGNLAREYYATLKKFTTRITFAYDVTVVAKDITAAQDIVDNLEYPQSMNHHYVTDSYSIVEPIYEGTILG